MYSEKEKFKITPSRFFWTFLLCSIVGTYYEEILHMVNHFFHYHELHWSSRRGLFWGPLSPVYGFGAVLLLFALGRKSRSKIKICIEASLLGGIAEYVMSVAQEMVTGTTSWDYSNLPLNIQGRTTIFFMLGWGLAGLVLIKWFYPKLDELLSKIPPKIYKVLTSILFALVFIDILISWTALARREMRHKGLEPVTFIGKFYDEHFDDEYVISKFPNMEES